MNKEYFSIELEKEQFSTGNDNSLDDLINEYEAQTQEIIEEHKNLQTLMETANIRKSQINSMRNNVETKKRLFEINLNKKRIVRDNLFSLKIILGVVMVLAVIPIIYKFNVLSKRDAVILWSVGAVVVVLVYIYLINLKSVDRDVNDFNKFNFKNPTEKEVALSKKDLDLSEAEQSRCQAFRELEKDKEANEVDLSKLNDIIGREPTGSTCNSPITE